MNFFEKPTIQNKMLIAILPLLFVQVLMVGGITLFIVIQQFNANINEFNQQRSIDILTIKENPDILNYLQNVHYDLFDEAEIYKAELEKAFERLANRSILNNRKIYLKICFIDSKGKEIAKYDTKESSKTYKDVSNQEYFSVFSTNKVHASYKKQIKEDTWIQSSPVYIDQDGDGVLDFSGIILIEYIYSINDFIYSAVIGFFMTLCLVLIGSAIIYSTIKTVKKLVEPIQSLARTTKSIATGNLNDRAEINSKDELGELAESFNLMAEDLQKNIRELEEYKAELEDKVALRTSELEKSNLDLSVAYKKLQSTQSQLIHSEKMASLGQLVAGVAHELNNPVNFIHGNMPHLRTYLGDLKKLLLKYDHIIEHIEQKSEITAFKEEINYDFLLQDLDLLVKDCENGAKRAKQIVQDLKNFSRVGEADFKLSNIHEGIDSTLNLLAHLYKNKIQVIKVFGDFPPIKCFPEHLNQVFMNLLSNAAQAMPKEKIDKNQAKVWITTFKKDDNVYIKIKDNASGIKEDVINSIFDPFFTTKPVGKGTGLGLSISYSIIEKHKGTIQVNSVYGEGTEFVIILPINPNKT